MPQWHIPNLDESDVGRLAELIALKLQAGDVVRLTGQLGAGKSTFARALIRAVVRGDGIEVPSPTFSIVQTYDLQRLNLAHLDLYRLQEAEELEELGLSDLQETHVLLVEWPEKLPSDTATNTLTLQFDDATQATHRNLQLEGHGRWSADLERLKSIAEFLKRDKLVSACHVHFMQGDASARSYARLTAPGRWEILMDAPRQADGPKLQDGKPYSQLACLAEDVRAFVAVDTALRDAGIAAPEIYDADLEQGLLRLEDFGALTFAAALQTGISQAILWKAATDVLLDLHRHPPPKAIDLPDGTSYRVPYFTPEVMAVEADLVPQWYWPLVHKKTIPTTAKTAYEASWAPHFECVSANADNWLLRDYHSPNLMWLSDRHDNHRVGVIDFQDALVGPGAYDLVSLLQDARLDVPEKIEADLFDHYCGQMEQRSPSFSSHDFAYRYAVVGAQRACKILGIFARLSKRDGKHAYLSHMPRIWRYLERNLRHSQLSDLKQWFDVHFTGDIRHKLNFDL